MFDVLDCESSLFGIHGIFRSDMLFANGWRPTKIVGDSDLYGISCPENAITAFNIVFRYATVRW